MVQSTYNEENAITILTGLPGSGKSKKLIETVNAARSQSRATFTFLCRDSPLTSGRSSSRQFGLLGCRVPDLSCRLDYFVSGPECASVLQTIPSGALIAVEEAHFFPEILARDWIAAAQRGVEVLLALPSREQVAILSRHPHKEERLAIKCERCQQKEAVTCLVFREKDASRSLCEDCDALEVREVSALLVDRLRRQAPYPGEEVLYQPVELAPCLAWRVLRPDSAKRFEIMSRIVQDLGILKLGEKPTYLDVGCNTGFFCHMMQRFGFVAEGVDVARDDVEVAQLLDAYIRRDANLFTAMDAHQYLRQSQDRLFDVTSAFAVFQWLMIQTNAQKGIECLEWLFAKTKRVCFLEMGYSEEEQYKGKLPVHIDRAWVKKIMTEKGQFAQVQLFEAGKDGLIRDVFVGIKPLADQPEEIHDDPEWARLCEQLMRRVSDPGKREEVAHLLARALTHYTDHESHRKFFELWQSYGFHVSPVHFYQPIPDTRLLKDDHWERQFPMVGVEMNDSVQLELLQNAFPPFARECNELPRKPTGEPHEFHLENNRFAGTDALAAYCMIRHFKPKLILEIGAGMSTRLSARAALRNGATRLKTIEPEPDETVRRGFPGLTELLAQRVQDVGLQLFSELEANDILFVDSSHVSNCQSDVNFLLLEVVPTLKPGVIVHFHDIFLPREYPRDWVKNDYRFWNEQYLLHAFLAFNSDFETLLANTYLAYNFSSELKACFPNSPWWGGGSFWFRRRA
jgi:SAM-dependent methyltransferase